MDTIALNKNELKNWFALYVSSRAEKKVMESLLLKGIHSYVPLVKTIRQWSDRKKIVEFPLLNGYVFVYISDSEMELTLQTKGVVSFVRSEGKKAMIRAFEIDRLKQLVALGYQMEVGGIKQNYNQGDKVKIISGVLKNIEGFVTENRDGRFIEIVLESIGQSIKVKLPEEILIPVK